MGSTLLVDCEGVVHVPIRVGCECTQRCSYLGAGEALKVRHGERVGVSYLLWQRQRLPRSAYGPGGTHAQPLRDVEKIRVGWRRDSGRGDTKGTLGERRARRRLHSSRRRRTAFLWGAGEHRSPQQHAQESGSHHKGFRASRRLRSTLGGGGRGLRCVLGEAGIHLRGGDAGVTQEFLELPEVELAAL